MKQSLTELFSSLLQAISELKSVVSIGKSGGQALPTDKESDIDVFVFCSRIPDRTERNGVVGKLGVAVTGLQLSETGGPFWGVCDFVRIDEAEICLMYFTRQDIDREIVSVLEGTRLDREGGYFYPTGRCASILSMHLYIDRDGYIAGWKNRLSDYPQELAEKLYSHHIRCVCDEEDFERAVARRDVLFFHAVLEGGLDHFLQAIFALNRCFFPSRKRSLQYLESFARKPEKCAERLLRAVELGAQQDTLAQAYEIWSGLCVELKKMAR